MPATRQRRRLAAGFTLLELMISIAILAIAAAIAVPTFSNSVNNARVRNVATTLQISLMRARSEATKRNANVRVLPVNGNWNQGWEVRDFTNNVIDAQPPTKNARITSSAIQVMYQRSGRLQPGLAPSFSIAVGQAGSEKLRCVAVDLSGRAYVKESAC